MGVIMQKDILSGLDKGFADRLIAVGKEKSYEKGTVLFKQGDPAQQFFILQKGRVRLSMGDEPNDVYTLTSGQICGWSALTGRSVYSATAFCVAPSIMISFDRETINELLGQDAQNAVLFYKNLAHALGTCLIHARAQLAEYLFVDDKNEYSIDQIQGMLDFV